MKKLKQITNHLRFLLGSIKPSAGPFKVQWDILYQCNSRCITCGRWSKIQRGSSIMPFERKKKFLDELAELNTYSVVFSGGEPFLEGEIFNLIKYAKKVGLTTSVNSNGLLINNEEMIGKILNSRLDMIHLSLDGAKPETNDYIRGVRGGFEKTFKAIRLLRKYRIDRPKIFINCTINNRNVSELVSLAKLCKDAGVDGITMQPAHNCSVMRFNLPEELSLNKESILLFEQELKILIRYYGNLFPVMDEYFNNFGTFIKNSSTLYRYRCVAAYAVVEVYPNGDVYPCPMAFSKMGNLMDSSFEDIWFSEKGDELRAKIKNGKHPMCWFTSVTPANILLSYLRPFKFYKIFKPKLLRHILSKMEG